MYTVASGEVLLVVITLLPHSLPPLTLSPLIFYVCKSFAKKIWQSLYWI